LVAARAHPGGTHLALGVAETVSEQVVMVRAFMCLDVAPVLIPPVRRSVPSAEVTLFNRSIVPREHQVTDGERKAKT
jgi:hypothetical protein